MSTPSDRFHNSSDSAEAPARHAFGVVPHDATPLAIVTKGLLIGAGGTLTFRAVDSEADVSVTVLAGQLVPVRAAFVRATGTTAAQIVGLA